LIVALKPNQFQWSTTACLFFSAFSFLLMSAEKLAFLQNFYTDVTLYLPAEPDQHIEPAATVAQLPLTRPVAPVPAPIPVPVAVAPRLAADPTPAAAPIANVPAAVAPPQAPTAEPGPPAVPPAMLTPFSTQGSNAQGVVLLVRLPHEQFIKLPRNVFLNKMLQALGLVMADVVLVNVESHLPVALASLRRELAATRIIAFGKNLLDVTIRNTQIYEPVQFPNSQLAYLASAEVEMVEYDVSLKKRLWPGLQRMFL
jgi:hypothetical protein